MVMPFSVMSHVCGSNPASPSPIIYLSKKFGKRKNKDEGIVNLDGLEISKERVLCYLGSIIHKHGQFEGDVNYRIKGG